MIRSGEQYKQSIRDDRVVYIDGERVRDVTTHPSFKPLVDIRARIYDMAHDPATREIMTVDEGGEKICRRPQASAHTRGLARQASRG